MVDAITAVGTAGTIAVVLMILGMLYLTLLGIRSDRPGTNAEPADTESE